MHDTLDLIRQRHSARVPFDRAGPVPEADLRCILEAARWAPTPHNMQNFEIVVVGDPLLLDALGRVETPCSPVFIRENYGQLSFSEEELRRRKVGVLAAMFPSSWSAPAARLGEIPAAPPRHLDDALRGSPTLLVVVYDPGKRAPASDGDVLGMMGLGCVMQSMWLVAAERGIGFQILSTVGAEPVEAQVKRLLHVPADRKIAFAARLGYPAALPEPRPRVRRDVGEFTHRDTWGKKLEG